MIPLLGPGSDAAAVPPTRLADRLRPTTTTPFAVFEAEANRMAAAPLAPMARAQEPLRESMRGPERAPEPSWESRREPLPRAPEPLRRDDPPRADAPATRSDERPAQPSARSDDTQRPRQDQVDERASRDMSGHAESRRDERMSEGDEPASASERDGPALEERGAEEGTRAGAESDDAAAAPGDELATEGRQAEGERSEEDASGGGAASAAEPATRAEGEGEATRVAAAGAEAPEFALYALELSQVRSATAAGAEAGAKVKAVAGAQDVDASPSLRAARVHAAATDQAATAAPGELEVEHVGATAGESGRGAALAAEATPAAQESAAASVARARGERAIAQGATADQAKHALRASASEGESAAVVAGRAALDMRAGASATRTAIEQIATGNAAPAEAARGAPRKSSKAGPADPVATAAKADAVSRIATTNLSAADLQSRVAQAGPRASEESAHRASPAQRGALAGILKQRAQQGTQGPRAQAADAALSARGQQVVREAPDAATSLAAADATKAQRNVAAASAIGRVGEARIGEGEGDAVALKVVRAARAAAQELADQLRAPERSTSPEAIWRPLVELTAMLPEMVGNRPGFAAPLRPEGDAVSELTLAGAGKAASGLERARVSDADAGPVAAMPSRETESTASTASAQGPRGEVREGPVEGVTPLVREDAQGATGATVRAAAAATTTAMPELTLGAATPEAGSAGNLANPASAAEAEPAALQELRLAALEDPSLRVEMNAQSARLVVSLGEEGKVALHLRINENVADVTVMGSAQNLLGSDAPELATALAEQGLSLGNFQLGGQAQGEGQRDANAEVIREGYDDASPLATDEGGDGDAPVGRGRPSGSGGLSVKA